MARLRAVEAALLDDRHAEVVRERIEHRGAHAAAGGGAGDDQAVGPEQHQPRQQVGAVEGAGLLLVDDQVVRARRDLGDDRVAVGLHAGWAHALGRAAVLPGPGSGVPVVFAAHAGRVEDGQSLAAAGRDQRLDRGHAFPGLGAAGIAPALDRLEDRLGTIAAEVVVDVDHQDRRTLSEALKGAVAARLEYLAVAFGEEGVPDRFGHRVLQW